MVILNIIPGTIHSGKRQMANMPENTEQQPTQPVNATTGNAEPLSPKGTRTRNVESLLDDTLYPESLLDDTLYPESPRDEVLRDTESPLDATSSPDICSVYAPPATVEEPYAPYYRGRLSHMDKPGYIQCICYRLADSVPKAVAASLGEVLQHLDPATVDPNRLRRIEELMFAGHGCCVLKEPEAARLVIDTWRRFDGERYDLIAWVVMSNHIHVLIRQYHEAPLSKIVQSWKSYTAKRIAPLMKRLKGEEHIVSNAKSPYKVWMPYYWDRYIRNERHFQNAVAYIHRNPVKAGLCAKPEDWDWSSAREYRGQ